MIELATSRGVIRDYSNPNRNREVVKRYIRITGGKTVGEGHKLVPYFSESEQLHIREGGKIIIDLRGNKLRT